MIHRQPERKPSAHVHTLKNTWGKPSAGQDILISLRVVQRDAANLMIGGGAAVKAIRNHRDVPPFGWGWTIISPEVIARANKPDLTAPAMSAEGGGLNISPPPSQKQKQPIYQTASALLSVQSSYPLFAVLLSPTPTLMPPLMKILQRSPLCTAEQHLTL